LKKIKRFLAKKLNFSLIFVVPSPPINNRKETARFDFSKVIAKKLLGFYQSKS